MEKYSKLLTVLLIIIIVGILGLVGYLVYDFFRTSGVDQEAEAYVQDFNNPTNTNQTNETNLIGELEAPDINAVETTNSGSGVKRYKGYEVLGTIEIPSTNVSYPVLAKVDTKSLEISVAALYPKHPVLNSAGNTVIVGHNYKNGSFFSNNKKLNEGDKIYITGLNNDRVTYEVYSVFEADKNDTSFYNRDTNGAREITLSTCTDDTSSGMRTIVLAKAQGD